MSDLQAGKETDERVARAMGATEQPFVMLLDGKEYFPWPEYSIRLSLVGEMLEWLEANKRAHLSLEYYVTVNGDGQWHVCFENTYGMSDEVCNPSLSLALCDAILATKGGE